MILCGRARDWIIFQQSSSKEQVPWSQIIELCFEYRLRVEVGPGGILTLTSGIRNTNSDGKSFSFTFAYHTYFSISDISEVRVEGLETLDYHDNLQERIRLTEQDGHYF